MSKLVIIAFVVTLFDAPISASAGDLRHSHPCVSLAEMVSCGTQGVKGNRAQFVSAITRRVESNTFLEQLPH